MQNHVPEDSAMSKRDFHFFQLEDRVLLSGEGLEAIDVVAPDAELLESLNAELDSINAALNDFDVTDVAPDGEARRPKDDPEFYDPADGPITMDPARPIEVIFIDEGVQDSDTLVQNLRNQNEDTQWVVVRLASDQSGIDQISSALSMLQSVDAIHLVSHGDGEAIQLGSDRLSIDSAPSFAGDIASWGHSLDTQADLLIYGCDLASTTAGRDLIDLLAIVTQADVAASDDATGHATLGGDWLLEYTVGDVETEVAFSYAAQALWIGRLDGMTIIEQNATTGDVKISNTDDAGQTFTYTSGDGTYEIEEIGLQLYRESDAAVQDITVTIRDAFNGSILTSATISSSILTTTMAEYTFDVANINVNDGQEYVIRVHADIDKIRVGRSSGSPYAGGTRLDKDGGAQSNEDLAFRVNRYSPYTNLTFQEGVSGYTGTLDTEIFQGNPGGNLGNNSSINVDLDAGGGDEAQALISFDNIFGGGAGQIPLGVQITSASLAIQAFSDATGATISLHQMLNAWDESSNWSDFGGLQAGDELSVVADATISGEVGKQTFTGLESTLQAWADGTSNNNGWSLLSNSTDGWDFYSSEGSTAPILSVSYIEPGSQVSTAHTLIVDTANDVMDGDTTSIDALLANKGADGFISLREAIWATNNTANLDASTPDVINFAIGSGAQTIVLDAALPALTDPVILDATTQTGYIGQPLIEIDGSSTSNFATAGITIWTSDSVVRGFSVTGSTDEGIEVAGSSSFGPVSGNIIENNWVGISNSGVVTGNTDAGILVVNGASNTIVRDNVVVGNGGIGIDIRGAGVDNTIVQGNIVGLTNDGTTAAGNGSYGIRIQDTATNTLIGTDGDGTNDINERNVIASNTSGGIYVAGAGTSNNTIAGNFIGLASDGSTARGNGGHGVWIAAGASNNRIGTDGDGSNDTVESNTIANNQGDGIRIDATSFSNAILGNSIYSNTGLAIDLGGDGVNANDGQFTDTPDQDSGANNLQNFPVLTSVTSGPTPAVFGSLKSTPNRTFRIEFFANSSGDASGYGEGQRYLDYIEVTTGATGDAMIGHSLDGFIATGETISATATDLTTNDTSEFAANIVATNTAPVLDGSQSPVLTPQSEDSGIPSGLVGTLISSLVDFASPSGQIDNVTDSDTGAVLGIAITATNTTYGSWYYTTNGGSSWSAVGPVSKSNALLLAADANTRLYFQPNANYNGTIADAIAFRAWDQTSGTNGGIGNTLGDAGDRYDSFTVVSYSNNNGSVDWTSDWIESEADGSPSDGSIQITGGNLQFGMSSIGTNIYRQADLLGATTATLTGTLVSNGLFSGESVSLQVSGNGGASYTTLYNISSTAFTGTFSFDISGHISADTRIRLYDNTGGSGSIRLDDARIVSDGNSGDDSAFSVKTDTSNLIINAVADAPIAVDDHHGLSFDGVDDYVNLGSDLDLKFTNSMTMELWARPTAYPATNNILLNREGEYEIGLSSTGSLMWAFANTDPAWSWHDTGHVLQLNQWSHIAVAYDNGTIRTYVNGHIVETYSGSGDIGDSNADKNDVRVGGRQNSPSGQYFAGDIDDVRLWSSVRSQTEIRNNLDRSLNGDETGLVGYWNFNESNGSIAYDSTINANHGVLTDEATTGAPLRTGYSTDQNTGINIALSEGVLQNDIDVDGDSLSVNEVEGSAANVGNAIVISSGATVTLNADGTFNYDPNGAFDSLDTGETAVDTFTYTVTDGNGGSDTATVSITVTGSNDAPTIVAVSDVDDSGNQVIDFEGGDDTITLSGLLVNTAAGTDVTVEFWMNWDGVENVMPFGFGSYDLYFAGGNFGFNTGNADIYGISSSGLANGWHHVTAIFRNGDATGSRLIIDGIEQTMNQRMASPVNGSAFATSNAQIAGWTLDNSYKFDGQIDQVRIWNGGRSETQVRTDMHQELSGPQTGLVASYSFTGATTGAGGVIDDSGNGHHGTMGGMTAANVIAGNGFANLGDQTVNEDDLVTLQVSAFDPENSALTYTWTQTAGPTVTLSDASAENPTFTATEQVGNYQVVFTVDASDGTNTTTETVTITVNAVNDDPTNAGVLPSDITVTEDVSSNVDLSQINLSDVDHNGGNLTVTLTTSSGGNLTAASGSGVTVLGSGSGTLTLTGTLANLNAYIDTASNIKYLHSTANLSGGNVDTINVKVSDNGNTGSGGGSDVDLGTANVDITNVNDAPLLDNSGTMWLPTITKLQTSNGGSDVASIIASAGGDRITDADSGAMEGIAITTLDSGNGTWQYSVNGGASWNAIGTVSSASALLLSYNDLVRFVPSGSSGTTANFDFHAWDQTSGTAGTKVDVTIRGGATAFSTASERADITVTDVNAAPVLDDSKTPVLTTTDEDPGAPGVGSGTLISSLVDFATPSGQVDNVTDADSGAGLGIAITDADTTNGMWFYSIDNGSSWIALGVVSDSNARLLAADANTRLYFQADADYHGTVANAITFHAWDQTSGTNGGTASIKTGPHTVLDSFNSVSYTNNDGTQSWSTGWIESDSGGGLAGASGGDFSVTSGALEIKPKTLNDEIYREVDLSAASTATLNFSYNNPFVVSESVVVQVSGDGGASYTTLYTFDSSSNTGSGSKTIDISGYTADNTRIRFLNTSTGTGKINFDDIEIQYSGNGGGSTAFSTAADTAGLTVNPVADTPSVTNATTDEDTQSTSGLVLSRNTVDGAEVTHFKITGITDGTLYKNDGVTEINNGSFITFAEGNAGLKFTPDADFNGTGNFTVQASTSDNDSGLGGGTTVANVTVDAVNDAPVNTIPGAQSVDEDATLVFSSGNGNQISIADVDADSNNVRIELSVDAGGALTLSQTTGLTFSTGNGSNDANMVFTGTVANINAALNGLSFVSATNYNGPANLTVTTNDLGNTGSDPGVTGDGTSEQDSDVVAITVNAVNDSPVVNGPGSALSATEQVGLAIHGTGFTVTDVDAASGTMTTTINVGEGAVTIAAGDSGISISSGNGTGMVTFTGTLSQIDNLLTGTGTGTITYLNSSDTPSASTTITVTVNDGGNTGADPGLTANGTSEEDSASQTINITATNDDPTNPGGLPSDITVTEDVSSNVDLSQINLSDVDHGGGDLVVTLTTATGGILTASSGGGVTIVGSNSGTMTLTGTLANLNAYLDNASHIQYLHSTANLNGDNADSINLKVNDNGNTGTGGGTDIDLGNVNVDITAVNDAPVITGGPDAIGLTETNAGLTANGSFTVSDVDTTDNVTAAVDSIAVGGTGSSSVPATLDNSTLQSFLSVTPTTVLNGAQTSNTLTWNFNSGGEAFNFLADGETLVLTYTVSATDDNGTPLSDTETVTVTITGTNDGPNVSVGSGDSATESLTETNTTLARSGTLTVSDADLTDLVTSTVTGVVTSGTTAGLGSDNAALRSMLSSTANVLDATELSDKLTWNFNSGSEAFDYLASGESLTLIYTIEVSDSQGATDTQNVTITVNGTNDAPVITGGPDTSSLTETDTGLTDTGTLTIEDLDRTDNVNAAVDSVAVSGTGASSVPGSLDNATLRSYLSVSPTAILDGTETSGTLTWDFNSGAEAFDFLANGETLVLTYTIRATDDDGIPLSDTETVTVTITGTNDSPDVFVDTGDAAAESLTETDATLTTTGTLSVGDLDLTDVVTSDVTGVIASGTTTGLASDNATLQAMLSSTGSVLDATETSDKLTWSFNSGAEAFDYLANGESLTLTYTIEVIDSQGATDTQNVTITVNGTNDAPVITGGPDTSSLTETDTGLTDTGTLTIEDLDRTDNVNAAVDSVAVSGTGASSVPGSLDNATLQSYLSVSPTAILDGTETSGTLTWDFNSGAEAFDFLANGETLVLTYTIRATDDDGIPLSDTETVTVTITGTNDSPDVYIDTGNSAAETLGQTGAALTTSGTLSVDDLDLTDSVSSTVSSVAASGDTTGLASDNAELLAMLASTASVIDGTETTNTLTWNFNSGSESFDYLASGESLTLTYTITVTDSQSATDTQNIVITITGNNNAPVITVETGDSAAETLTETNTTLTSTGTLTVTDSNLSDTVSSTVTGVVSSGTITGLGSDNAALQAMLSSSGTVLDSSETSDQLTWSFNSGAEAFDYLASGESLTLTYTIEVIDSQGATDTQNVVITVSGTGDAPVITDGPDASSLTETDSGLADTGTFTIEDLDRTDNVNAAVDSVAVSGTGVGSVPGTLNNSTLQSYLTVSPTAVLDNTETTNTLTWNFNSGTEAFDFLADGETLILTYVVSATDDSGSLLSDTETVTVTITGTNDGPTASVDTGTATESGGIANATVGSDATGSVLSNDTDVDVSDSLSVVGVAAGSQGSASGSVASNVAGTFGTIQIASNGSYTYVIDETNSTVQALRTTSDTLQDVFTYTVEDSNGANSTAEITITIQGANDNPHDLATTGLTVIESANDGTSVGTITPSDVDSGDTATFTLTDDANGRFTIDPNTGEVTVADTSQLDHETDTTHNITVRVTDTAGATYDETFVVTITDANEYPVSTPTDTDAAANEVNENSAEGISVGITADAFDLDSTNNTVTYSLTSNPDGLFQIDPNTGEVTTSANAIDRETHGPSRSITVQATSSDGSTATETFNIAINDLNEFNVSTPTDSDLGTNEVDENVAAGTTVGVTADSFDLDATNNTITYSLSSNPGGLFQIDSNTGEVTVAGLIDRESSDHYDITVTATSSDTSSASQSFTIYINDINEFVVVTGGDIDGTVNEVDENSAAGTLVGITVLATDSDATNSNVQYTMFDDADGRFDVDLYSGVVTVASGSSLNFEHQTSHDIIVRSTSDDGSFVDQTFTIQVRDVNEAPVALGDGVYTAIVGQSTVLDSPHLLANDIDVDSDPLRVVIIAHPANGTLQIDLAGDVTYTPNPGYFGSDSFSYQADDGSLTSNTATVTIDVTPGSSGGTGGSSGGEGSGDSGGSTGSGDGSSDGDGGSDSGDSSSDSGGDSSTDGNTTPVGPGGTMGSSEDESTQAGRGNSEAKPGDGSGSESGEESAGNGNDARGQGVRATSSQSERVARRFGFGDSIFLYDILNGESGLLNGLDGDSELNTLLSWHLTDNGSVQINETYDNEEIHVGAVGTTLGLASIGYVLWALRGGMFIATMYAGIPSWRMLDPASLLSAYRGADGAAQDKVEEMLD